MVIVDLFCGCGGFSLGAHRAGFDVAAAFDVDPVLTSSFAQNFPNTELVLGDIARLTGKAVIAKIGGHVDGVIGGPPCQGFSTIGRRDPNDPRRTLVGHFFRLVQEIRPSFFVFENVTGLATPVMQGVLQEAMKHRTREYKIFGPTVLDAASFGAATSRRRLFVVGIHRDYETSLEFDEVQAHECAPATVHAALVDLTDAYLIEVDDQGFDRWKIARRGRPTQYAQRLRSDDLVFTGHRIIDHKSEIVARFSKIIPGSVDPVGRHPRLRWDGQCPTLRAGTGPDKGSRQAVRPIHPEEPRVITVREAARLQGFPDKHLFHKTTWHSFRMIGNSVSPIIAESILTAVASKFGGSNEVTLAAD
ncbi:MAG: DNA cytosine methyltransferase [Parvibaculum sp.]|uniref:DNA cytosine methyltransferase n=1 Tax=Parvibaculum sp. TaxID=2024848 RepID=UPI0032638D39